MKYKTITVFTNHNDADLISSAMFDAGAGGVSILDKQDFLDLVKSDVIWDYVDESVLEQSEVVKVSTMCDLDDNDFLSSLLQNLEELKKNGVQFGEILTDEIDAADYEKLLEAASKKLGSSPEQLRKALDKGDVKALSASLSKQDKEKLRAVLENRELMAKLKSASSPDDIMRMLGGK